MTTRAGNGYGQGAITYYGWDALNQLPALIHEFAGTSYDLTLGAAYNPAGQATQRTESNAGYTWSAPAANDSRTYDGLNRDSTYTAISGYDSRGNLTSDGSRTFAYDLENRLVSVGGSKSLALAYDPEGRLRSTASGGTTTQFLYAGTDLIAELNGSGTTLRKYIPSGLGGDMPIAWLEGVDHTNRRYFHTDRQGSVIAWSDINAPSAPNSNTAAYEVARIAMEISGNGGNPSLPPGTRAPGWNGGELPMAKLDAVSATATRQVGSTTYKATAVSMRDGSISAVSIQRTTMVIPTGSRIPRPQSDTWVQCVRTSKGSQCAK